MRSNIPGLTQELFNTMTKPLRDEIDRLTKENAQYRADLSGKDDLIDKLYAEISTLQKEVERVNEAGRNLGIG